ncbi:MAG: peptidylprolyl isomerase [Pirellulaceae bacterium]|nr:peptidylprolyl isomerase [Pirellulaceae bacterium]
MPLADRIFGWLVPIVVLACWSSMSIGQEPASKDQEPTTLSLPASGDTTGQTADTPPGSTEAAALESVEIPPELLQARREAKDEFLKLRGQLAVAMGEMRATFIRYQNDEDRSPEAQERYRQQRNATRKIMNEMFDAALNVIRFGSDDEAATYLATMIEHRYNKDYYDATMMEAGARLIDGSVRLAYIFPATARSAVVSGDFELAKQLYDALDEETLPDIDKAILHTMGSLQEQWEKEQELQKQDGEAENPLVSMMTTRGEVTIELFINSAPSTVANFIQLVEKGYYDGLDFYQVIDHLLALTGDESGSGTGTSGKFLLDEHERENARMPLAGSLVMAKQPTSVQGQFVPNSASAQFAILYLPIAAISDQQTVFGRVIEGMDAISELRRVDPSKEKKKNEILLPPDRILEMKVIRRPEKLPEIQYFDAQTPAHDHDHDHDHAPVAP